MFGGTYELDVECIEAECLGPHQGEFQGKRVLLRDRMPAAKHIWQSKR